jgi:hypothetical protein
MAKNISTVGKINTNWDQISQYNLSLPKRSKKKARELAPVQFANKLEMASKFYIYGFKKFKVSDLKTKYNLTLPQATEMFKLLTAKVNEFKQNNFGADNTALENAKPKRVVPTLEQRLTNIRIRYSNEIKQHGEQASIPEGFIYLIKNPAWDGWIKAGMTIDYVRRLGGYNSTYDPHNKYTFVGIKWVINRKDAEASLMTELEAVSANRRGEWFQITEADALTVFNK